MKIIEKIIEVLLACVVEWLVVCVLTKLITMCFGLIFTWSVATGIWLILRSLSLLKILFLDD